MMSEMKEDVKVMVVREGSGATLGGQTSSASCSMFDLWGRKPRATPAADGEKSSKRRVSSLFAASFRLGLVSSFGLIVLGDLPLCVPFPACQILLHFF